ELGRKLRRIVYSVAQHDKRTWDLAGGAVGHANYTAIAHRRMLQQHGFHLCWRDSESLVLDHLLEAVHDPVIVALIAASHVARPVPTVAQGARSRLGRLPVAEHELRPTHHQLANTRRFLAVRIHQPAFSQRNRHPDRIRTIQLGLDRSHMGDWGCLGHAVTLAYKNAGEFSEAIRQACGQGRSARLDCADTMVARKASLLGGVAESEH